MLNVSLDELRNSLKKLVQTAVNQYQEKCLLSFSRTRDKKVYQKSLFPRVILDGEHEHQSMNETISKAMASTLANHNGILLNGITNAIKEAFNLDIQNGGPTYSVPGGNKQMFVGQTLGDQVCGEFANMKQCCNIVQQSVQQPMLDYSQSVSKVAPQSRRIARDLMLHLIKEG